MTAISSSSDPSIADMAGPITDEPSLGPLSASAQPVEQIGAAADSFHDAERAIRGFQQSRGLVADGVLGTETSNALADSTYALGDRILEHTPPLSMRGDDVADLQARLQSLGYYAGRIDGIFAEVTRSSLTQFQSECGLDPTGRCTDDTVHALWRLRRAVAGGSRHRIREEERLRSARARLRPQRIAIDVAPIPASGPADQVRAAAHALRNVATLTADRLAGHGVRPILLGDRDGGELEVAARAARADASDADAVISVGLAGGSSSRQTGVATYCFALPGHEPSPVGAALAELIQRAVIAGTDAADCGTHGRAWEILRLTRTPRVVVELGFLAGADDVARLRDRAWRQAVASAMADAVHQFFTADRPVAGARPLGT